MCLFIGYDNPGDPQVSTVPVIVYKMMQKVLDKLKSPYYPYQDLYEIGKEYTAQESAPIRSEDRTRQTLIKLELSEEQEYKDRPYYTINEGFHSCDSIAGAEFLQDDADESRVIVECEIPADTQYYYSSDYHEYVSLKIKFIRVISERSITCFYLKSDKPQTSTVPITCYKEMVPSTKEEELSSLFFSDLTSYNFNTVYSAISNVGSENERVLDKLLPRIGSQAGELIIDAGFHSYKTIHSVQSASMISLRPSVLVKCEIPPNTEYYENDTQYVSTKIKFIGVF